MSGGLNIGALDIALSLTAIGASLFLFEKGKKAVAGYTPGAGGIYGGSIDPNWTKDPPIYDPDKGWIANAQQLPVCQVWNDAFQLYVDSGCKDCNASPVSCFELFGDSARYITEKGDLQFQEKDPLSEPKENWGKCFFWDGSQFTTFQDNAFLPSGEPFAPINRSEKLCFAADTPDLHPYKFENTSTGAISFGPTVSYSNLESDWLNATPAHTIWAAPKTGPVCEEFITLTPKNGGAPTNVWANTEKTGNLNDIKSCLSAQTGFPVRWNDQDGHIFYFNDAATNQWVQTNYNPMPSIGNN